MEYKLYRYLNEYSTGGRPMSEPVTSRAIVKDLIATSNVKDIELNLESNAQMGLNITKERYSIHSTGPIEKDYKDPYFVVKTDRYLNFKYNASADKYTWSNNSKISPFARTDVVCKWFNDLVITGGDGSIPFGNLETAFKVKPEHIDVGTSYYTLRVLDINRFQEIRSNSIVIIKSPIKVSDYIFGSGNTTTTLTKVSLLSQEPNRSQFQNKTVLFEISTPTLSIGTMTNQNRWAVFTISFNNTNNIQGNPKNTLLVLSITHYQNTVQAKTSKVLLKCSPIEDFAYLFCRTDYESAQVSTSSVNIDVNGYLLSYADM